MTARLAAARRFAEVMGWEFHLAGFDVPHPTIPNAMTRGPKFPAADAPLREHLAFVGRVAEAIGVTVFYISHGIEYAPGKRSTTIQFQRPVEAGGCADDLSWAALLAGAGAKEKR